MNKKFKRTAFKPFEIEFPAKNNNKVYMYTYGMVWCHIYIQP